MISLEIDMILILFMNQFVSYCTKISTFLLVNENSVSVTFSLSHLVVHHKLKIYSDLKKNLKIKKYGRQ